MATIVYFVFPEYEDGVCNPLVQKLPLQPDCYYRSMLKRLDETNDIISSEEYDGRYDNDNVSSFLNPCGVLPEEYPQIDRAFRLALKEYEDCSADKHGHTVVVESPYRQETRCSIFEVISDTVTAHPKDSYLILYDGEGALRDSHVKFEGSDCDIQTLPFDIRRVFGWFCEHRNPGYRYVWNPKHGECGKGIIPNKDEKVSLLLGLREEAEALMHRAIAVVGHAHKNYEMFAYDGKYGKYMEYKYDNAGGFHSYHLEAEDEKEIPKEVLNKMKQLGIDRDSYPQ